MPGEIIGTNAVATVQVTWSLHHWWLVLKPWVAGLVFLIIIILVIYYFKGGKNET